MNRAISKFIEICTWDQAQFLMISENVFGNLIYYSHFFAMVLALSVGWFVISRGGKILINRVLAFIMISFSGWVFCDLVVWATDKPEYSMFFWATTILLEVLVYALCVYFMYLFVNKKDTKLRTKFFIFIPILPIIIFLPTKFILQGFDLTNCYRDITEGFFATYYVYAIEIMYALSIIILGISKSFYVKKIDRKQIALITFGLVLFLISFASGNIIGSFTENWTLAQVGLFSMPIFVVFLGYMIVKFKSFNAKLIGAQVLVFALGILVMAMGFIRKIENVQIVVLFTIIFVFILGKWLVAGVQREVKQREKLEELSKKLESSNKQLALANDKLKDLDRLKTEFLSLASHQLRSPLTAIKGYASMVLEGDYGKITKKVNDAVSRIFQSSNNLQIIVEDLLNVSKIEQGGMKFEMTDFDFAEIVKSVTSDLSINANTKNIKLSYITDPNKKFIVYGDQIKLRQVVLNFVDNSIKYTREGHIETQIIEKDGKMIFSVKDTGMGLTPEIISTLFQKFNRGDGARMNTSGSGLGLYLAKEIVKAHGGRVWVESEGLEKGSTFFVELRIKN